MKMSSAIIVSMALALGLQLTPVVYADDVQQAALTDREQMRGRILFIQCRACHAVAGDAGSKTGPSLIGVFGRQVASSPTYTGYSQQLREAGFVWDDERMDEWIASPASLVPGNLMAYAGMADPADRALLVRYLREVTQPLDD